MVAGHAVQATELSFVEPQRTPCMANQTWVVGSMTALRACAMGFSITCKTRHKEA